MGCDYHIFCSDRNLGASNLLTEFVRMRPDIKLEVTGKRSNLEKCERMLVYLTGQTWTGGRRSTEFADRVEQAMRAGLKLLLVHEMPGPDGQEERHGVEFSTFFACANGSTPAHLLQSGIYSSIAVPFKGGEWRRASIALLAMELASTPPARVKRDSGRHSKHKPMRLSERLSLRSSAQASIEPSTRDTLPSEEGSRQTKGESRMPISRVLSAIYHLPRRSSAREAHDSMEVPPRTSSAQCATVPHQPSRRNTALTEAFSELSVQACFERCRVVQAPTVLVNEPGLDDNACTLPVPAKLPRPSSLGAGTEDMATNAGQDLTEASAMHRKRFVRTTEDLLDRDSVGVVLYDQDNQRGARNASRTRIVI